MNESTTSKRDNDDLAQRALAAVVELQTATEQRTALRQERVKLMDGCERCREDEALCVARPAEEWCHSCKTHGDWPERYKAASKRRRDALQRVRYIALTAMKAQAKS